MNKLLRRSLPEGPDLNGNKPRLKGIAKKIIKDEVVAPDGRIFYPCRFCNKVFPVKQTRTAHTQNCPAKFYILSVGESPTKHDNPPDLQVQKDIRDNVANNNSAQEPPIKLTIRRNPSERGKPPKFTVSHSLVLKEKNKEELTEIAERLEDNSVMISQESVVVNEKLHDCVQNSKISDSGSGMRLISTSARNSIQNISASTKNLIEIDKCLVSSTNLALSSSSLKTIAAVSKFKTKNHRGNSSTYCVSKNTRSNYKKVDLKTFDLCKSSTSTHSTTFNKTSTSINVKQPLNTVPSTNIEWPIVASSTTSTTIANSVDNAGTSLHKSTPEIHRKRPSLLSSLHCKHTKSIIEPTSTSVSPTSTSTSKITRKRPSLLSSLKSSKSRKFEKDFVQVTSTSTELTTNTNNVQLASDRELPSTSTTIIQHPRPNLLSSLHDKKARKSVLDTSSELSGTSIQSPDSNSVPSTSDSDKASSSTTIVAGRSSSSPQTTSTTKTPRKRPSLLSSLRNIKIRKHTKSNIEPKIEIVTSSIGSNNVPSTSSNSELSSTSTIKMPNLVTSPQHNKAELNILDAAVVPSTSVQKPPLDLLPESKTTKLITGVIEPGSTSTEKSTIVDLQNAPSTTNTSPTSTSTDSNIVPCSEKPADTGTTDNTSVTKLTKNSPKHNETVLDTTVEPPKDLLTNIPSTSTNHINDIASCQAASSTKASTKRASLLSILQNRTVKKLRKTSSVEKPIISDLPSSTINISPTHKVDSNIIRGTEKSATKRTILSGTGTTKMRNRRSVILSYPLHNKTRSSKKVLQAGGTPKTRRSLLSPTRKLAKPDMVDLKNAVSTNTSPTSTSIDSTTPVVTATSIELRNKMSNLLTNLKESVLDTVSKHPSTSVHKTAVVLLDIIPSSCAQTTSPSKVSKKMTSSLNIAQQAKRGKHIKTTSELPSSSISSPTANNNIPDPTSDIVDSTGSSNLANESPTADVSNSSIVRLSELPSSSTSDSISTSRSRHKRSRKDNKTIVEKFPSNSIDTEVSSVTKLPSRLSSQIFTSNSGSSTENVDNSIIEESSTIYQNAHTTSNRTRDNKKSIEAVDTDSCSINIVSADTQTTTSSEIPSTSTETYNNTSGSIHIEIEISIGDTPTASTTELSDLRPDSQIFSTSNEIANVKSSNSKPQTATENALNAETTCQNTSTTRAGNKWRTDKKSTSDENIEVPSIGIEASVTNFEATSTTKLPSKSDIHSTNTENAVSQTTSTTDLSSKGPSSLNSKTTVSELPNSSMITELSCPISPDSSTSKAGSKWSSLLNSLQNSKIRRNKRSLIDITDTRLTDTAIETFTFTEDASISTVEVPRRSKKFIVDKTYDLAEATQYFSTNSEESATSTSELPNLPSGLENYNTADCKVPNTMECIETVTENIHTTSQTTVSSTNTEDSRTSTTEVFKKKILRGRKKRKTRKRAKKRVSKVLSTTIQSSKNAVDCSASTTKLPTASELPSASITDALAETDGPNLLVTKSRNSSTKQFANKSKKAKKNTKSVISNTDTELPSTSSAVPQNTSAKKLTNKVRAARRTKKVVNTDTEISRSSVEAATKLPDSTSIDISTNDDSRKLPKKRLNARQTKKSVIAKTDTELPSTSIDTAKLSNKGSSSQIRTSNKKLPNKKTRKCRADSQLPSTSINAEAASTDATLPGTEYSSTICTRTAVQGRLTSVEATINAVVNCEESSTTSLATRSIKVTNKILKLTKKNRKIKKSVDKTETCTRTTDARTSNDVESIINAGDLTTATSISLVLKPTTSTKKRVKGKRTSTSTISTAPADSNATCSNTQLELGSTSNINYLSSNNNNISEPTSTELISKILESTRISLFGTSTGGVSSGDETDVEDDDGTETICYDCKLDFKTRLEYLRHVRKCRRAFPKIVMAMSEVKKFYNLPDRSSCPICKKPLRTTYKSSYIKHLHTHTKELNFKCRVCKLTFRRLDHMKAHAKRHEGSSDVEASSSNVDVEASSYGAVVV